MDRARDQRLAGARLALDEDRGRPGRHPVDDLHQLDHRPAVDDERLAGGGADLRRAGQLLQPLLGLADDGPEVRRPQRAGQEVGIHAVEIRRHLVDGGVRGCARGTQALEDDEVGGRVATPAVPRLDAADVRHFEVEAAGVELAIEQLGSLLAGLDGDDRRAACGQIALDQHLERPLPVHQ